MCCHPHHDPLALADREEQLAGWLEGHLVEAAWQIASTLAAAGADIDWCERVAAAVRSRGARARARMGHERSDDQHASPRNAGVDVADLRVS